MTSLSKTRSECLNASSPTIELCGGKNIKLPYEQPAVLGDFVLEDEIGRGGMGIVYRAIEKGLGRTVALKVLPNTAKLTASKISRFQIEAKSAAQLTTRSYCTGLSCGLRTGYALLRDAVDRGKKFLKN